MQEPITRNYSADLATTGKNMLVAYLFWWFLGSVGAHRFYLNKPGSAFAMISLLILGFFTFFVTWIILGIWWLIDGFLVYQYVTVANAEAGQPSLGFSFNTSSASNLGATKNDLELLEKAHILHQQGILSENEYLQKRKQVLGSGDTPTISATHAVNPSLDKKLNVLNQLAQLKADGILTEAEFNAEKRKLLDN